MRIVKKILFILAIITLLIAAIGFVFFPHEIHVERSISIYQKERIVYNYLNNPRNWNSWSPWYELDTTTKFTFEEPLSGIGASIKWESPNKDVGNGYMKIIETKPDSLIGLIFNFMEGGMAKSFFRLSNEGDKTKVKWGIMVETGANPLLRILGSFMDGFIGKDFERGLTKLKINTEKISFPIFEENSSVVNLK